MTAGAAPGGRLPEQLTQFGRLLREAGLPIGPDRILQAVRTASAVGLERRDDVYWALHTVFVTRPEQHEVFDLAFERFFRERGGIDDALRSLLPQVERAGAGVQRPGARRLAGEDAPLRRAAERGESPAPEAHIVASWSDREALRVRDFAQMSAAEARKAQAAIARLRLRVASVPSRRFRSRERGRRVDARASLRAGLRALSIELPLRMKAPRPRPAEIVLLCDISGSMSRYSRMLLHFGHALMAAQPRVHVFVFGTRLTAVTRWLRGRDVDRALARVGSEVPDWSGGTRIGGALREFNRRWSRRVLASGATVLLVTDGLDRENARGLAEEAARLRRSCHRLVWLNPLLRYAAFEPRAEGIRALLPHVDDFRPAHDLASLEDLARVLSQEFVRGRAA